MTDIIDFHVHFFPPAVFRAIWRYFEVKSKGLWKINYRLHGTEHVNTLKENGIVKFTSLVYAHKPGMADDLNEYIMNSVSQYPELIPFGTVFAGDPAPANNTKKILEDYNFCGIKMHPFVTGEMMDDPRFFPVYEIMEGLGKILICHPGSGPIFTQTDGADRTKRILEMFPNLKIVIAHCGAKEYDDYRPIADRFEHVYFDTAMNCTRTIVFSDNCPGRDFFIKYQDRILYGSDFPNIPYKYSAQIEGIKELDLGNEIERKIFRGNAKKLLGV